VREGPVWSLSLVDALTVDDFESYSNASPGRPFQIWLDGFGYSADEFFPAGYGGNEGAPLIIWVSFHGADTAGLYDLYEDGAQMLLNAVDYMLP
jgi:hypothetical protein